MHFLGEKVSPSILKMVIGAMKHYVPYFASFPKLGRKLLQVRNSTRQYEAVRDKRDGRAAGGDVTGWRYTVCVCSIHHPIVHDTHTHTQTHTDHTFAAVSVPYICVLTSAFRLLSQVMATFWGTVEDVDTRLDAFMRCRELAIVSPSGFMDKCLKGLYLTYVGERRFEKRGLKTG